MNKVLLVGRLTRDPDVRYGGANNVAVARFTVAVDRRYKREGDAEADFISCVAFGKTAEFVEKYFHKGNRIGLEGRIQTGKYDKDGTTVYTTDIMVENVEFVESKGSQNQAESSPTPVDTGFLEIPEGMGDELPFN